MGPFIVVDPHPCLSDHSSLIEAVEGKHIEHFVTKGSIEPLDVSVLVRLAFLNEDQPGLITTPILKCLCDKLRAIVYSQLFRPASPFNKLVQFPDHPLAGQACVDGDGEDFAIEIIDDIESPECFPLEQTVMHKIH